MSNTRYSIYSVIFVCLAGVEFVRGQDRSASAGLVVFSKAIGDAQRVEVHRTTRVPQAGEFPREASTRGATTQGAIQVMLPEVVEDYTFVLFGKPPSQPRTLCVLKNARYQGEPPDWGFEVLDLAVFEEQMVVVSKSTGVTRAGAIDLAQVRPARKWTMSSPLSRDSDVEPIRISKATIRGGPNRSDAIIELVNTAVSPGRTSLHPLKDVLPTVHNKTQEPATAGGR